MNHLTRHGRFDDVFSDFARGFLEPIEDQADLQIRIDVKERRSAYQVHADLPGVKKEDIQVTVDGNVVTIRAESRRVKEQKEDGERLLRSERYVGSISRSFQLPYEVDMTKAEAKYQDGVLELTLPKREAATGRQLKIQ